MVATGERFEVFVVLCAAKDPPATEQKRFECTEWHCNMEHFRLGLYICWSCVIDHDGQIQFLTIFSSMLQGHHVLHFVDGLYSPWTKSTVYWQNHWSTKWLNWMAVWLVDWCIVLSVLSMDLLECRVFYELWFNLSERRIWLEESMNLILIHWPVHWFLLFCFFLFFFFEQRHFCRTTSW